MTMSSADGVSAWRLRRRANKGTESGAANASRSRPDAVRDGAGVGDIADAQGDQ
jgi:hypothetical protein